MKKNQWLARLAGRIFGEVHVRVKLASYIYIYSSVRETLKIFILCGLNLEVTASISPRGLPVKDVLAKAIMVINGDSVVICSLQIVYGLCLLSPTQSLLN